jgi:hypothetical protein
MSPKTVLPREEEQLDGVLFAMLVLRGFWCAWLLKCLIFCVGASDEVCSYVDYRQLPPMTTSTQHELPSASACGKPRRNT